MFRLIEESARAMSTMMSHSPEQSGPMSSTHELAAASKTMADIAQHWMSDPAKLIEAQTDLMQDYVDLWANTTRRMMGEDVEPLAKPAVGDNRFRDPEWNENPYFDFCKQFYLLSTNWAEALLERTEGLEERERHKARFHLNQIASACSPTNFPGTNPEVLRETLATNARNLVEGLENLIKDMENSDDLLKISQTDSAAFEVGGNLAMTPGKVIYQNEIMQLIQYKPTTKEVHATPLLIVPPWINKFYILDLTEKKSFIRYVVSQGFTVFVISWVNPDERHAGKSFADYMKQGILEAAEMVRKETGEEQCNVLGYCVAGTLLSATLAYLADRGEEPFKSATFLTTQVDFSKAGDLTLLIGNEQLKAIEAIMAEKGYLDGSRMASVFNMLRPRDLIWPYIVNNYMLGKKPMPFDLLYWNQDSTRMPAANHNFYLAEFYGKNSLAEGKMVLDDVPLDMRKVKLPVYELAAREDHIAPAASVYRGSRLLGGPVEFVLAGSGHIAGVINPPNPEKPKYQHWTGTLDGGDIDIWLKKAQEHPGSWWPHWIAWLSERSGDMVKARKPGKKLKPIEDAPGSYVKVLSSRPNNHRPAAVSGNHEDA
ncbi:MAG: class I poly(R)-hydroxyalkanoic acid synthase [Alphaproteobacteria bacterium]|nr:class I poly(R)-hydroxyalkanoic acid synthase [Alphaproteobacteria bacterium]